MRRSPFAVACLLALTGTSLAAQETPAPQPAAQQPAALPLSSSKGIFLGFFAAGSTLTSNDLGYNNKPGGGSSLEVGYGFTPQLSGLLSGTITQFKTNGRQDLLGLFDFALRYSFTSPTRRFVPSLELGYAGRAVGQTDAADLGNGKRSDLIFAGAGATFGVGAQYYVQPQVALGGMLRWNSSQFTQSQTSAVTVQNLAIDGKSAQLTFGATWYPRVGR